MQIATKRAKAVVDQINHYLDVFARKNGALPECISITPKQAAEIKAVDDERFFGRVTLKIRSI